MKKKLKLEYLKVQSFATALGQKDELTLQGGDIVEIYGGVAPPPSMRMTCNHCNGGYDPHLPLNGVIIAYY